MSYTAYSVGQELKVQEKLAGIAAEPDAEEAPVEEAPVEKAPVEEAPVENTAE